MGIVKQQAYKNTIIQYAGMVIAYVNTVLLFPFFATSTEYGFYNLTISISVLYSLIASMGIPGILLRYFPFYRTEDKRHNGFIYWTLLISLLGFVVASVIYVLLKPVILSAYAGTSPLYQRYYYYLIPMSFFVIAFNYLEMTGRIVYITIYSNFLQSVLLRLLTTAFLVMMSFKWINYQDFIFLYIASNGLVALLMFISILASGQFSWRVDKLSFKTIEKRAILNFGMFTVISSSIYVLLQKVDTLMLSAMAGDDVQGVYSWYFNIAIVISVPAQALNRTTYPIVSNAWKSNDMKSIDDVYSKTSIIQMVVGCLLFIGVIVNRQNLYAIAHNKEFVDPKYFSLFIVVGLGFLVDVTGGLNAYIITASHKYKLFTLFVVVSVAFCVLLNYLLIPKYKGLGSAIAYLFTLMLLNFITWFYIKYRFKLQPFRIKHIWVIIITILSFFIGYYFWKMPNVPMDIIVRSGVTTLVYISLVYLLHISPDINEKIDQVLVKLKIKTNN